MSELSGAPATVGGEPVAATPEVSPTGGAARPEDSPLRLAVRRFLRHRLAVGSLAVLLLVALLAFVLPFFWRFKHDQITPENSSPPTPLHPLGTNNLGHDLLAQILRGTQQSLAIALVVATLAVLVGTVVGIVAGYRRGRTDAILMRVVDLFLTVPTIAVAAVLGHNFGSTGGSWVLIALVLAALMWTHVARVVRSVTLELRERDFVAAARTVGASEPSIMLRHILPNVSGPIIVAMTILVASAILAETALSFIGFGVRPPDTSLGLLVASAQSAVTTRPWLFYFPGIVILVIALTINFVGDGLRDALDPAHAASGVRRRRYRAIPTPAADRAPVGDGERPVLRVRDLRVTFDLGDVTVSAARGVDFTVGRGEVLGLVGESGSGKSVTASAIMGLLPPSATLSGSIQLHGEGDAGPTEVVGLSERAYTRLRGNVVSMVFQDPMSSLSPVHTVGHQVAEAVRIHQGGSWREAAAKAERLLTVVGIPAAAERMDDYPHHFSGGMRQRVVIAMAIANDPDLIIADEPTTALDVTVQAQVLDALTRVAREANAAVLLITHDLGVVGQIADRIAVMYAGRIVETGPADAVLDHPVMPYTRGLLDSIPKVDGSRELTPIPGSPPALTTVLPGCSFAPRCRFVTEVCRTQLPTLDPVAEGRRAACFHPLPIADKDDHD